MEQEFTTSTGFKIYYGAAAVAATIASGYLLTSEGAGAEGAKVFFGIILLLIAAAIGINLYKRKVIFFDDRIIYTSVWGTKEMSNSDIKGFRVGEKAIFIEPLQAGYSRLKIRDYLSIGRKNELVEFLSSHYTDLNKLEFEEEKEEILQDTDLGQTEEDRETAFKNIRRYVMIFNFIGLGLFFFAIYFHENNYWLRIIAIIFPLTGLALMRISKGLIRLYAKKSSAYPTIFIGMLLSSVVASVLSFIDTKIISFDNLWVPAIIVFMVIFSALYYLVVKLAKAPFLNQVAFIVIISAAYGFGGTLLANSIFDPSQPQVFPAKITDHHVTRGSKSTTYHIIIGGWGNHAEGENISVSSSFYDRAEVGSIVHVNLKKGLFNVPWYFISQ